MSQVTRPNLSRGVKLLPNHVTTPLTDMATELAAGITADQLKEPAGVFRLNFHRPVVGGRLFLPTGNTGERGTFILPFVLPPPQDRFSSSGLTATTTPVYILEEFQLSFDQRGEPAGIRDTTIVGDGNLDFDNAAAYDLHVAIREKAMRFYGNTENVPGQEVIAWTFPNALYSAPRARMNPLIVADLGVVFQPYRTYALYLNAEELAVSAAGPTDLALVSFHASMRFRCQLMEPDTVVADAVQNIPAKHNGTKTAASVVIQAPAPGDPIRANGVQGVQTNLETIDAVLAGKLRAGYGEWSDLPVSHHLQDDAAYEVMAIPMFAYDRAVDTTTIPRLPYVGAAPYTGFATDRRVIPLVTPWVLHHVVAVMNWSTTPAAANLRPSSANLGHAVGVGLGHGLRADNFLYQEIAYGAWADTQVGRSALMIDELKERLGGQLSLPPGAERDADFALLHIPLVYPAAGGTGASYYETGRPIFMGRSLYPSTSPRTNIASQVGGAMGVPATLGREQFIEVRWRFGDVVNGLGDAGSYPAGTVFVGYGGFTVLLIGKKPLMEPDWRRGAI